MFRRISALVFLVAVVGAACGGGDLDEVLAVADPSTTSVAGTTAPPDTTSSTSTSAPVGTSSSTTTTTTTTTTPPSPVGPALVVAHDDVVELVGRDGTTRTLVRATRPVEFALGLEDGTVFTSEVVLDAEGVVERYAIVRHRPDGTSTEVLADGVVFDVAVLDGRTVVLAGEIPPFESGIDTMPLLAVDVETLERRELGLDWLAPEWAITDIDAAGPLWALSANSDLTEVIELIDPGDFARVPGSFSPTDGLAYGQAPFVTLAELSPDRSQLAWVEGPEYDVGVDPAVPVGRWEVVVADTSTGAEVLRRPIGPDDPAVAIDVGVVSVEHLGDRVVLSLVSWSTVPPSPLPVVVVDLVGSPGEVRRAGFVGVATVVGA